MTSAFFKNCSLNMIGKIILKNETTDNHPMIQTTLLGRLQEKWLNKIGVREHQTPNGNEIKLKLLEAHRDNPAAGKFLIYLISQRISWNIRIDELAFGFDLIELLNNLENKPWHDARFLEIKGDAKSSMKCTGVLIYQEAMRDSGNVYVATIFDENSFPLIVRLEIRACISKREPFCSILTTDGYQHFALADIREKWDETNSHIKTTLLSLYFLNDKKTQLKMRPEEGVRLQEGTQIFLPPPDQKLEKLLNRVIHNKLGCTRLQVPLSTIKPADYEFCMLFPAELVLHFLQEIRAGDKSELLVYWNKNAFIMSDDYAAYLAYRTLHTKEVPVIAIGNYPVQTFGFGERGGRELLPNITYSRSILPLDQTSLDAVLDSRLQRDLGPKPRDKFYEFIFQFHRQLNNPLGKERELHNLILKGASNFTFGPVRIFSEVCFGKKYRADLVLQIETDNQRLLLIELERASLPLFTKTGAQFSHVTHALQQVEDWLRFWQEHPKDIPKHLDPTISPAGVVVIGRSRFLSEDDKRRLLSLNMNRRIQLITYDDLISRIEFYVATMA